MITTVLWCFVSHFLIGRRCRPSLTNEEGKKKANFGWNLIYINHSSFNRFKRLRTPANVFIINLTTCDFLSCCLHPLSIYSAFRGRWSFGQTGRLSYIFSVISFLAGRDSMGKTDNKLADWIPRAWQRRPRRFLPTKIIPSIWCDRIDL